MLRSRDFDVVVDDVRSCAGDAHAVAPLGTTCRRPVHFITHDESLAASWQRACASTGPPPER
jgi:hypothetical protein